MVKEVSAGAIVFKKENNKYKYLMVRHLNEGHYSFPKGHIEKNESIMGTAKREVFEETGINFEFFNDKIQVNTYLMPNGIYKDVYYFLGEAINDDITIQLEELDHADWYSKLEVLKMLTHENDKLIFVKITGVLGDNDGK